MTQIPSNCADGVELTDVTVYSTQIQPFGVVVGDFNSDGQQDVGIREWESSYEVAFGQGNGALGPMTSTSAANWISYVTIAADANHNGSIELDEQFVEDLTIWADFTNDGILDKVRSRIEYGDIGLGQIEWKDTVYSMDVYTSNANGTLTLSNTYNVASIAPNVPGSNTLPTLGAADFNGDGNLDLAIASYKTAQIRLGQGNGTFAPTNVIWTHGMDFSNGIHVVDVNQDGHADVVVLWGNSNNEYMMEAYLGQGDGTFSSQSIVLTHVGNAFADITKDGKIDLLSNASARQLRVQPGHGDGTFGAGKSFAVGGYVRPARVADMDNDGRNDLVTPIAAPDGISVLLNRCTQ